MRLLRYILVLALGTPSAWATLGAGVESATLIPGSHGERTLVVRSGKMHITAHGRPALLWAQCEIHATPGAWGSMGEVGINHHGSYSLDPRFQLDLPSDLLSAMATPRGWRNELSIGWYQGSLAKNRPGWAFLASLRQAAEVVVKTKTVQSFSAHDWDILLNACGVPRGLNPRLVDTSELVY